jgi:hypothetical protein
LNQESITICSREQLMRFPPHSYMLWRTGLIPLNVLIFYKYWLLKLQTTKIKKFQSPEVCHRFRVLTVFSFSTLVLALAYLKRYWEQTWLCHYPLRTSWGKHDLDHRLFLWYKVSSQYPLFVHCNFKAVHRNNVQEGIAVHVIGWAINDVVLFRVWKIISFNNFSNFFANIFNPRFLYRQKPQSFRAPISRVISSLRWH